MSDRSPPGTRPSAVGDVFEKMYMMFVAGSS
jgi:hypothetical protein